MGVAGDARLALIGRTQGGLLAAEDPGRGAPSRGRGQAPGEQPQCTMTSAPMPNGSCPMPHARCLMPNAQCLMPNAPMPTAQWQVGMTDYSG